MSDDGELSGGGEVLTTFMKFGEGARPVQYTVVDGRALTEGCIILGSATKAAEVFEAVKATPGVLHKTVQGVAILGHHFRWPDATLVFEVDPTLSDEQRVDDAMQHWRDAVGIKFRQRQTGDDHFVRFVPGGGCSSAVGMRGGPQELVLGPNCTKGNCIHEIGHALGLWHEQSRIDRDLHVRVHFDQIIPGREFNFFQRLNDGIDIGKYDPGSIMHYPLDAFAIGAKPTIELLDQFGGQVGQRVALSDGDKDAIKQLYGL